MKEIVINVYDVCEDDRNDLYSLLYNIVDNINDTTLNMENDNEKLWNESEGNFINNIDYIVNKTLNTVNINDLDENNNYYEYLISVLFENIQKTDYEYYSVINYKLIYDGEKNLENLKTVIFSYLID